MSFVFIKTGEKEAAQGLSNIDDTRCCYWHLDKFHKLLTGLPVTPEIGEEGGIYSEKAALQCLQNELGLQCNLRT